MNSVQKELYEVPATQVVDIKMEAVILTGSLDEPNPFIPGGDPLNP